MALAKILQFRHGHFRKSRTRTRTRTNIEHACPPLSDQSKMDLKKYSLWLYRWHFFAKLTIEFLNSFCEFLFKKMHDVWFLFKNSENRWILSRKNRPMNLSGMMLNNMSPTFEPRFVISWFIFNPVGRYDRLCFTGRMSAK